MRCINCEATPELSIQLVTVKYKECGLDNITLQNVPRYHCEQCGQEYYQYGDLEKLHQAIADLLLSKKDLLTGAEIRFLRKHLGLSGALFAKILARSHESLSRLENGQDKITTATDHFVRFVVAHNFPDRKYALHELFLQQRGTKLDRITLNFSQGQWWRQDDVA